MSEGNVKFLLIGLGNVGCKAVRRALESLLQAQPNGAQALLLDTDINIASHEATPNLTPLRLDPYKCARAIQVRQESPVLYRWWPNFPVTLETEHGLFGNKALARLSFIINIPRLAAQLDRLLELLAPGYNNEETPSESLPHLEIFFCATLGGGTSSSYIEVAYLLQSMLSSSPLSYRMRAFLPLSNNLPPSESVAANVYASLVELNHWMNPKTLYTFAVDMDEYPLWDDPEGEKQRHGHDASTAAILSSLDIRLADDVVNVNPGLKKVQEKIAQDKANEEPVKYDVELSSTANPPFCEVIFSTLDDFDDEQEVELLARQMVRWHYWYFEAPELWQLLQHTPQESAELARDGQSGDYLLANSYQLANPTRRILDVVRALASRTVVTGLRQMLFEKDIDTDRIRGQEFAKEFIATRSLDSQAIHTLYQKRWLEMDNGLYNVRRYLEGKLQELQENPRYGRDLENFCRTCDAHFKELVDHCETEPDFFVSLSSCTKELTALFHEGLKTELQNIVDYKHNGVTMLGLLDELSHQLSISLSALHERSTQAQAEAARLAPLKNQAVAELIHYEVPAWKKFMGKVLNKEDDSPISAAFQLFQEYYSNILLNFVGREEANAFFEMLNACEDAKKSLQRLREYLNTSEEILCKIKHDAYTQILRDADLAALSTKEAANFIDAHSKPSDLPYILKELDQRLGYQILNLPQRFTQKEWLQLLRATVDSLYPLPDPHVLQTLHQYYPGHKLLAFLQTVEFNLTSPFEDSLQVPLSRQVPRRNFYAAFDQRPPASDFDPLDSQRQALADELTATLEKGPFPVPVTIVANPQAETIDLVRTCSDFKLDCLDLDDYKEAYLVSLGREARAVHSRKDIKFNSFYTLDNKRNREITSLLALAFKMGILAEKISDSEERPNQLTSNRWLSLNSLRAVLSIYANPIEALYVENTFYQNLKNWRKEQMGSMGLDKWLQALEPSEVEPYHSSPRSYFRSLDLENQIKKLKPNLERDLESRWPTWEKQIAKVVGEGGEVRAKIATIAPPGMIDWLERRWLELHPQPESPAPAPAEKKTQAKGSVSVAKSAQKENKEQTEEQEGKASASPEGAPSLILEVPRKMKASSSKPNHPNPKNSKNIERRRQDRKR